MLRILQHPDAEEKGEGEGEELTEPREFSSLCLEWMKNSKEVLLRPLNTVFSFTLVLLHCLSHQADPLPPTTDRLLTLLCFFPSGQDTGLLNLPQGNFYPAWGGFEECTAKVHSLQHKIA